MTEPKEAPNPVTKKAPAKKKPAKKMTAKKASKKSAPMPDGITGPDFRDGVLHLSKPDLMLLKATDYKMEAAKLTFEMGKLKAQNKVLERDLAVAKAELELARYRLAEKEDAPVRQKAAQVSASELRSLRDKLAQGYNIEAGKMTYDDATGMVRVGGSQVLKQ